MMLLLDQELQDLRNMGNLPEAAADEIARLRGEVERLLALTYCGCGDQFSAHDPGTCGNCCASMQGMQPGA